MTNTYRVKPVEHVFSGLYFHDCFGYTGDPCDTVVNIVYPATGIVSQCVA